jgi:hypothetical protein
MLKNRTIEERSIEIAEEIKNSIQMNNDQTQLLTSLESSSSQIISLRSELIEDDKVSRFQSFDVEDVAESSNVTVRRNNKEKKSQLFEFDQLLAINQTSLDATKFQIDLEKFQSFSKDIESVDLNEANILSSEEKLLKGSRWSGIMIS